MQNYIFCVLAWLDNMCQTIGISATGTNFPGIKYRFI